MPTVSLLIPNMQIRDSIIYVLIRSHAEEDLYTICK